MNEKTEHRIISLCGLPWWLNILLAAAILISPELLKLVLQVDATAENTLLGLTEQAAPVLAVLLLMLALCALARDVYKNWRHVHAEAHIIAPATALDPVPANGLIASNSNNNTHKRLPEPTAWSAELLQSIEWHRFDDLCVDLFKAGGMNAMLTIVGSDSDVDVEIYSQKAPPMLEAIARCKAWCSPVGVKEIRALQGLMASRIVHHAYYVTSSTFTDHARAYAGQVGIELIDTERMLEMLAALPQTESLLLLKKATKGDYTTPACPRCGIRMVKRSASGSGNDFWGCRNYPGCKGQLYMRQQGVT